MKKKCDFYNYRQGDCMLGPNSCVWGCSPCPIIMDKDVEVEERKKLTCRFCKQAKGINNYFCNNKNSEWYEEHCIEMDIYEPMVCSDKKEK